jgi:hypothetical protein
MTSASRFPSARSCGFSSTTKTPSSPSHVTFCVRASPERLGSPLTIPARASGADLGAVRRSQGLPRKANTKAEGRTHQALQEDLHDANELRDAQPALEPAPCPARSALGRARAIRHSMQTNGSENDIRCQRRKISGGTRSDRPVQPRNCCSCGLCCLHSPALESLMPAPLL